MSDKSTLGKRCVVLTRESVFYIPEQSMQLTTTSTPQKSTPQKQTPKRDEYIDGIPRKDEEDVGTSTFKTAPVAYMHGFRLLVLALPIILLALMYFYKRDSLVWNSAFALIGVLVGYSLAWAQRATNKGLAEDSSKSYDD